MKKLILAVGALCALTFPTKADIFTKAWPAHTNLSNDWKEEPGHKFRYLYNFDEKSKTGTPRYHHDHMIKDGLDYRLVWAYRILYTGSAKREYRVQFTGGVPSKAPNYGTSFNQWEVDVVDDNFSIEAPNACHASATYFENVDPDWIDFQVGKTTISITLHSIGGGLPVHRPDQWSGHTDISSLTIYRTNKDDVSEALNFILNKCTPQGRQGKTVDAGSGFPTPETGGSPATPGTNKE